MPLTTNVFAAQNAVAPTVVPTGHDFCDSSCTATTFAVTITNPASNQYAITAFTLTFPASSGWTLTAAACGSDLSTMAASSTNGIECTGTLPPGFTDTLNIGTLQAVDATSNTAVTLTITTTIQDAGSSPANYAGPSFKVYGMGASSIDITDSATVSGTITAGGSDTLTGTWTALTGNVGNILTAAISAEPTNGDGKLSLASGTTDSTGSIKTVFTATVSGTYTVDVNCDNPDCGPASFDILVNPAAVAKATVTLPDSTLTTAPNHYETNEATDSNSVDGAYTAKAGVTYSVADRYGNAINFNTLTGTVHVTLTALSGQGRFDLGGAVTKAAITCSTDFACPPPGLSAAIPFDYYQSTVYGTVGKIGVTITATGVSVSGSSGNIITSTFATASPTPTPSAPAGVGAGSTVTVGASLTSPIAQQGVPVTLQLDVDNVLTSAVNGDGMFSTSKASSVTVATDSTGAVSAKYAVDTGLGAVAYFNTNVAQPIDGDPTNMLGNSTLDSAAVTTIAGPPATFIISACFDANLSPATCGTSAVGSHVVNGTSVYVDVSIADAFGNPADNPGPNQIEMTLSTTSGLLSVAHAYITVTNPDTFSSLGWVAWTMPVSIGTGVTITATGVLSGKSVSTTDKVTTVSGVPTFSVTSPAPVSGVIYSSSTTVVFNGEANASIGYPPSVTIDDVNYKIGTGAWQAAVIAPSNAIDWSIAATFPVGLGSIMFSAIDSNGNMYNTTSYKVLVDTSTPTVKFTTAANANLTGGAALMAKIVSLEGDLNSTSVSATVNGTAVVASSIVITGANNLGHNTTYTIQIKNLPTGFDNVVLSASSYAGNTGSASISVHVIVPFSQSVIINSAASGTLGAFTGISVSATNLWSTSQNLVVFAVWKNSAGQTVAVTTGGLTLASGATGTTFAPLAGGLPSGSYTVSVFVITTSNNPVSSPTSITATQ